jgi:carbamoyl-phosphate synthase large subunit
MKATGEVMAIDRTFEAALGKAVRSLEFGSRSLLWEDPAWRDIDPRDYVAMPTDERLWAILASLRRGATPSELSELSGIDPWFLDKMSGIVQMEERLLAEPLTPVLLRQAKRLGLSDADIGTLADRLPEQVRELRQQWDVLPVYKMVDTCAAEFEAETPYFYSTYDQENEAEPLPGDKALVIGSGPIRIGQGIEFDYSAVHAAWALQEAGVAAIMANSNPETVSTDFDTSDRLYFEPLDEEGIRDLLGNETNNGTGPPSIVQFGGQTAINLALPLARANQPILGSSAEAIDIAEDRSRFEELLQRLGIPQPPGAAVMTVEQALSTAQLIGYPVLVRPSYVLGGRAMEIVQNARDLIRYVGQAAEIAAGKPILIDKYLEGIEAEVDAICDGEHTLIPGVMEHIERAGVHSGDSFAVYPAIGLFADEVEKIVDYTQRLGPALGVKGLMNVQYVIMRPEPKRLDGPDSDVYVIEVNPRASRTVPFVAKVIGKPVAAIAAEVMAGKRLADFGLKASKLGHVAVKEAVFPFARFPGVDPILGPEMRSTGEVMGIDRDFAMAFGKSQLGAGQSLPTSGTVFVSVKDSDKDRMVAPVRQLEAMGFKVIATRGTKRHLEANGVACEVINKVLEGRPHIVDAMKNGDVALVFNTTEGAKALADSKDIRRTALLHHIPYYTTLAGAVAVTRAIKALKAGTLRVAPLQSFVTHPS